MANVQQTAAAFFRSKGLPDAAIAALLGNMQIESSFNTGALNPGEAAIGLFQWEGGRRTNLQNFAASMGTSETDLNTQLQFAWHELSTDYSGVLQSLKTATDPAQAAALVDSNYEVSSGSSHQDRMNAASSFFSNGKLTIPTAGVAVAPQSGGGTPISGGSGASGGGGATLSGSLPGLSQADYESSLGNLAGLLDGVPELKGILQQATTGQWSTAKFQEAVNQSSWYKTHNQTVRQALALKYSDPATYNQNLQNSQNHIGQLAAQLGVTLTPLERSSLADQLTMGGWDDTTLSNHISRYFTQNNGSTNKIFGQAATTEQQLQQLASEYGTGLTSDTLTGWTQAILSGAQTTDSYKQFVLNGAKAKYPGLTQQLDDGLTVNQIADPYRQSMAQLLELDPNAISLQDPNIKQALQGTTTATNGKATTATMPVWQFENQVRSDPRWAKTQNAVDTVSSALLHVGQDWGFGG